ncbi:hypothetical protein [Pseudomonas phage PA1C]|nr:hypothetical protein [Pseudomonas phage PA1C]
MFWNTHGHHVEQELTDSQMNPGDIVVMKENTTVSNNTSNQTNSQTTTTIHPTQDENMSHFANRFEKQIRHVNISNGRCYESGGTPEEKQRSRNTRKGKGKTRVAHGKRGDRNHRDSKASQTSRYEPSQERSRPKGRKVEMVLDRIVLNGKDQPFPCGSY